MKPEDVPMNRQQRRRALVDGHHRSALRAVSFWRSEARAGRAHTIPLDLAPFVAGAERGVAELNLDVPLPMEGGAR